MRESLMAYCLRTGKAHLLREWMKSQNEQTPDRVAFASRKKVWWQCGHGHVWESRIDSRSQRGSGCPYCSNHTLLPGFNDLASQRPDLVAQWYQPLNGSLTPKQVLHSSHRKVWWQCALGHVWKTEILVRTVGGHGCPICAGQGKNSVIYNGSV